MKKITVVDATRLTKYIDGVSFDNLSVGAMINIINSGKYKYDPDALLSYLITYVYDKLNNKANISNNKLEKFLYAVTYILLVYNEHKIYIGDDLIEKASNCQIAYINNRSDTGLDGSNNIIDLFAKLDNLLEKNQEFKKEEKEEKKEEPTIEEKIDGLKHAKEESALKQPEPEIEETEEEKTSREAENLIAKLNARVDALQIDLINQKNAFDGLMSQSVKDQNKITDLNKKIDASKQKLQEARKETKRVKKELENYEKNAEKKIKKLEEYKELALQRETQLLSLSKEIDTLESRVASLEAELNAVKSDNVSLRDELDAKNSEILVLNSRLAGMTTGVSVLDEFIMDLLFEKSLNINQIMDILEKNKYSVSKDEVLESLQRINKRLCVMPITCWEKKYGITSPAIRTNQKINVPNDGKVVDIMLLADYHLSGEDNEDFIKAKLDSVYNYCAGNGIGIICTLGDLLDNKNIPMGVNKEAYAEARKLLEQLDDTIPMDVNIKHFILGGNHDRGMLKYGFDPIEELIYNRDDLISLGYDNAFMFFGGSDVIGLHHEGVPREERVPNIINSSECTVNNIRRSYDNGHINFENRYFDLLGHFHSSRFNPYEKFGVVPSLNTDRNSDGAWHIRIFRDGSGRIEYIIINMLVFGKGSVLRKANESVYQKERKK